MSERSERLFTALNEIDERKIEEAAPVEGKRPFHWKRWAALAAAFALVIGVGSYVLPRLGGSAGNGGAGGAGADGASTFMSYAGPVFPLTLAEADPALTAEREVTMAFQETTDWISQWGIQVTDAYTLTNTSEEDKIVSVLYPFASELLEMWKQRPALTVDGQPLETTLHAGPFAGGYADAGHPEDGRLNLSGPNSWEGYKAALVDGSYQAQALGEYPDLSGIPVTVYQLTDPWVKDAEQQTAPAVHITFELDFERTKVLSYGFNGFGQDPEEGRMDLGFFLSQAEFNQERGGAAGTVIVIGDDISNVTAQGSRNLAWEEAANLREGDVTIRRYETDLDSALRSATRAKYDAYLEDYARDNFYDLSVVDYEMYHGLFCERLLSDGILSDDPVERYTDGMIEDLDVAAVKRVFYLEAEVTVPAGGSVQLTAEMWKQPSYDFYCAHTENQGVHGYDMVTKLGSNLTCTGQTAVLEDNGCIEIVRQNFGFDLENGVKKVTLDPDQEHYYLEVKQLPEE